MANESEMIAQPTTTRGINWGSILATSLVSSAVSATVGYFIGKRPATACSCKKKPNNDIGGEKAA